MEKGRHGGSEKVLYKTKGKLRLKHKEPEEVDCLVTENHVVMEAQEPIRVHVSRIQRCEESHSVPAMYTPNFQEEFCGTVTLTCSDDENKKRKLSLDVAIGEEKRLKCAIGRQMLGRFFHKAEERAPRWGRGRLQGVIADLRKLGVEARLAPRGRIEEDIGEFHGPLLDRCLGVIGIPEWPVRWVAWYRRREGGYGGSTDYYWAEYGVPDPRLQPDFPSMSINEHVRNRQRRGGVADVFWKGNDSDLGILRGLNSDERLKKPIMETADIRIRSFGDYGCWLIIGPELTRPVFIRELWDCYQAIGWHLLADWPTQ